MASRDLPLDARNDVDRHIRIKLDDFVAKSIRQRPQAHQVRPGCFPKRLDPERGRDGAGVPGIEAQRV